MVFSSTIFLFLCLPIMLTVNLFLPRWLSNPWLLLTSLFFYAWGETVYLWVMLLVIGLNYAFGLLVAPGGRHQLRGAALAISVVVNLGILASFKYAHFLVDNLNAALALLGAPQVSIGEVHLPLGISFFTFQAMSYVIDVYRGNARVARNPLDLGLYIALFPQLVAGPIIAYEDVAEQIRDRKITWLGMSYGVRRFLLGLSKKVLIANTVAIPADQIFSLPVEQLTPALAWMGIVCYTLQIYFDFSGYSDMAIGIGHMLGFRFMENFRWPYISQSIREFWRRWHISLSSWFRDYLYIPLGGNRHGNLRTGFNLVTVFFLCGLWHGASWTFVVWGLYHGAFLVLERTRFGTWMDAMPRPIRHGYVLVAVMVGWVFFRAESFDQSWRYLTAMAGFAEGMPTLRPIGYYLRSDFLLAIAIGLLCATPVWTKWVTWREQMAAQTAPRARMLDNALSVAGIAAYMLLFILCAIQLSSGAHNPFIYFRF